MKKPLFFVLSIFLMFCSNKKAEVETRMMIDESHDSLFLDLKNKAKEAYDFCSNNGYDTNYCLLFDVSIHSGKNRMFLWNFKNDTIEMQSLCAHGCGKGDRRSTGDTPLFGNENGCFLTSLGKYKIGKRSYSNWGINVHYKLHGLEESNNKAFERIVVLHSYSPVPQYEIYPQHLPMGISQGCPVIDDNMMTYLDNILQKQTEPTLLWIYYDE